MKRWILPLAMLASLTLGSAGCSSPNQPNRLLANAVHEDVAVNRSAVRAMLAAHRAQQVERLHAYGEAGQFPHDVTVAPALHMFKDAEGRFCAVANLIHQDGRDDLVDETARAQNDLEVADVHGGEMYAWMLASGLTQEELARIQLPAPYLGGPSGPQPHPQPQRALEVAKVDPPPSPIAFDGMMIRLVRAHVTDVEAELRRNEEASLELAVERWVQYRAGAATDQPSG